MGSRGEGWPRMNADETLAALGSGSEFDPSHRLDTHVRGEFLVRKHLDGWSAISTKCRSVLRAFKVLRIIAILASPRRLLNHARKRLAGADRVHPQSLTHGLFSCSGDP